MPPEVHMKPGLSLSQALLNHARKTRLSGDTGTVLMIDAKYFLQREVSRAFRAHGWKVISVNVKPENEYIQKLLEAILLGKPDFLFTVNHLGFDSGGIVTGLLEQIELPAVSWFVDSPAYILLNHIKAVSPWIITPVWERTEIKSLQSLGFETPFWLPLATDPELMGIGRQERKNGIAGFVGDSMELPALKWQEMLPVQALSSGFLKNAVEKLLSDRSNQPSGEAFPASWDDVTRLNFASAAVLEATRQYRHKYLNCIADKILKIWGDEGWKNRITSGAIIADKVDYYRELPFVYASNLVNLNFTSFQMPTAVNQRVFDVPAAGGFLLTDAQSDLFELFGDDELALFVSVDDFKEKVDYYLKHPVQCEQISRRAYRHILETHTYYHRTATILKEIKGKFAKAVNPIRSRG